MPPVPAERPSGSADRLVTVAIAAGSVCTAATLGVLLGLGRRSGAPWRVINATASTVLGVRADGVWGFEANVTLVGVAVVLVMSGAAAVVAAWLASSRRTLDGAFAAFGVAFASYLVHLHVVAGTAGGLAELLTVGELRALYCTAAIALAVGMRYAYVSEAGASR